MRKKLQLNPLAELAALVRLLDWNQLKEEVEQEKRARIVLTGAGNAGKSTLLNQLKGWSVSKEAMKIGVADSAYMEDWGFFTLIDLPSDPCHNGHSDSATDLGGTDRVWATLLAADLILLVLDGAVGLRQSDYEWYSRLRAAGKPILVVLNKCDMLDDWTTRVTELKQQLGTEVIPISARLGTDIRHRLIPRMVAMQPALATALGREVIAYRREACQLVTRRAAMLCALLGTEPIPLLDLPFQALVQTQMILRVAAIYEHSTSDRYSRELIATFAGSVLLRCAAQQLAKFVPVGGFLISAGVASLGTWTLGQAAIAYFQRCANAHTELNRPRPRRRSLGKWFKQIPQSVKEKIGWLGKHFGANFSRVRQR